MVSQESMMVPQERVMVPQERVMVPQERVMVPQESMMIPQEGVIVPQESEMVFQGDRKISQESQPIHRTNRRTLPVTILLYAHPAILTICNRRVAFPSATLQLPLNHRRIASHQQNRGQIGPTPFPEKHSTR
jgi:hypothetical protein